MNALPGLRATVMGLSSDGTINKKWESAGDGPDQPSELYCDAFSPRIVWPLVEKLISEERAQSIAERRFLRSLKPGDVAYLWPGSRPWLYEAAGRRGCTVVAERINTMMTTSRRILSEEYARLGLESDHGIDERRIADERKSMRQAHFIFSPSPSVTQSIIDAGISADKVIETSYGLRREDIFEGKSSEGSERPVTAIFVGQVSVRKGVHLLLRAWERSHVDARLRIVGKMWHTVEALVKDAVERRDNIEYLPFVEDLRPVYQNADFFLLPSLEEGSPLVTYLALGAGLPSVVSPMGAGGIIEHGREGLVVDPHDTDALADAIRRLATDTELRRQLGANARAKARHYTWDKVAARRGTALLDRVMAPAAS